MNVFVNAKSDLSSPQDNPVCVCVEAFRLCLGKEGCYQLHRFST